MSSTTSEATKAMTKLSINPTSSASKGKSKSKKQVVADSWEDEESSASETETEPPTPSKPDNTTQAGVAAPPPTPISPSYGRQGPDGNNAPWMASSSTTGGGYGYRDSQGEGGVRRPEKTDAVARRMIASALGVRAPKQTEEQKAYDRAVREKERKKREEEREAQRRRTQEAEKAKAAIWDD
ncbi:hypothetical protein RRF57_004107 [Xylaria bambusicola]|uniref:Ubiquitin smt3 n=1 Tax=Xylaria bambusicola TaxID=326684 RepID=A0AAN7UHE1_9PEZI